MPGTAAAVLAAVPGILMAPAPGGAYAVLRPPLRSSTWPVM